MLGRHASALVIVMTRRRQLIGLAVAVSVLAAGAVAQLSISSTGVGEGPGSPTEHGVRPPAWRHLGPFGAARLAALGVSATSSVLYAVAARDEARVFRSADDGRTWSVSGTMSTGSGPTWQQHRDAGRWLRALAVDARDADRVFAATEDGVYVTSDGGQTWRQSGPSEDIVDVDAAPSRPFVYALEKSGRLYRSRDGGERWEPLSPSGVTSVAVVDRGILAAGGRSGTVWLSGDDGATWSQHASTVTGSIVSVTIQPPETISATSGSRLVRSTDGGLTWRELTSWPAGGLGVVVGDPMAPEVIFLGKYGVSRSRDGGVTWQRLPNAPGAEDETIVRSITFVESRPGTLYLNTGASGAWISADRGSTWRDANGDLTATSINDVVSIGPRQLYVAADNGVYRTTDAGGSWQRLGFGEQVWAIAVDPAGTVYAAKGYGGAWKRPPHGAPHRILDVPAGDVVLAPSDPRRVFVSTSPGSGETDHHFRSLDAGRTWRRIDTGPLTDTGAPEFAIDPRNPALVYAAVYANLDPAKDEGDAGYRPALLKSVDSGSTWKFTSLSGGFVSKPTVDPLSPGRIYVRREKDGTLLRSDNAGVSWRPTGRLPGGVDSYALDRRRQDRLWAVANGVFYRSDDAGRLWAQVAPVRAPGGGGRLWIDPASERMYVEVRGFGLYGAAFPP